MNGPAHYREAERLLVDAERLVTNGMALAAGGVPASEAITLYTGRIQQAHVHATLALAAALDGDRDWTNEAAS